MKKRLGIIFKFISVLFLFSCGIPAIYVPRTSDISITKNNIYFNTVDLNSSLLRTGYPAVYLYYQIVPQGVSSSYPYSAINDAFKKDYCAESAGRSIPRRNGNPFYTYEHSASIDGTSVKSEYGLYQFIDMNTGSSAAIPVAGISEFISNNLFYTLTFNEDTRTLDAVFNTASGDIAIPLGRYNNTAFLNGDSAYISNEIPSAYSAESDSITSYELKVYALVSLQFNNYNNVYNTKPVEILSYNLQTL